MSRLVLCSWILLTVIVSPAAAGSLGLGVQDTGIALGDAPRWTGLRLNAIDSDLEDVRGLNLTLWKADRDVRGRVNGIGIGLWGPHADELNGIHAGGVIVEANRRFSGVAVALGGVTAGGASRWQSGGPGDLRGIMVGGLGVGAAGDVEGIAIGGLGMGTGGDLNALAIGGLGMGIGGSARGVLVAGLGAGIGEDLTGIGTALLGFGIGEGVSGIVATGIGHGVGGELTGISVAGIGAGIEGPARGLLVSGFGHGIGGDVTGISLAGFGAGVGGDFRGASAQLFGMGVGGELTGLHVAGFGIAAERTRGITVALGSNRGEIMRGATVSAYNRFEDEMHGLSIGLINVTDRLRGVQLGLINIVRERDGWNRVLPILNVGR